MQQKQCPRCGAILHENQSIHWQCVAIRTRQKLGVPVGGAVAVLLVVLGIGLFTSSRGSAPEVILPTQMFLPTSAPATATTVPARATSTPAPTKKVTPTKVASARATGTKAAPTAAAPTATGRARPTTPAGTATTIPDSASTSVVTATVFSTSRVNVRSGPGRDFDSVTILSPGSVLTVTGRTQNSTWLKIITDDEKEGWVVADLIKLDEQNGKVPSISSLPVVADS